MIPVIPADKHREFDQLEFALAVHGPRAATLKAVRALARSPLWLETRILLQEYGFTEAEIAHLMGGAHPSGCPCWKCVRALHIQVRNHMEKLKRKTAARRRRPV